MSLREAIGSMASTAHIKIEAAAPAASYVANGFVFTWGAVTLNQILMLIGTVFAAATYFTSLYFQKRRDRREQEFHQHRLEIERQTAADSEKE